MAAQAAPVPASAFIYWVPPADVAVQQAQQAQQPLQPQQPHKGKKWPMRKQEGGATGFSVQSVQPRVVEVGWAGRLGGLSLRRRLERALLWSRCQLATRLCMQSAHLPEPSCSTPLPGLCSPPSPRPLPSTCAACPPRPLASSGGRTHPACRCCRSHTRCWGPSMPGRGGVGEEGVLQPWRVRKRRGWRQQHAGTCRKLLSMLPLLCRFGWRYDAGYQAVQYRFSNLDKVRLAWRGCPPGLHTWPAVPSTSRHLVPRLFLTSTASSSHQSFSVQCEHHLSPHQTTMANVAPGSGMLYAHAVLTWAASLYTLWLLRRFNAEALRCVRGREREGEVAGWAEARAGKAAESQEGGLPTGMAWSAADTLASAARPSVPSLPSLSCPPLCPLSTLPLLLSCYYCPCSIRARYLRTAPRGAEAHTVLLTDIPGVAYGGRGCGGQWRWSTLLRCARTLKATLTCPAWLGPLTCLLPSARRPTRHAATPHRHHPAALPAPE